jgi:hypothetical protein
MSLFTVMLLVLGVGACLRIIGGCLDRVLPPEL